MSQSSVEEQIRDLESTTGFPVRRGTRMQPPDDGRPVDLCQYGSDVWFSRWSHNFVRNFPLTSKSFGIRFLHNACHGLPAFVVGVGPSLDESLKELKELKGRALVIATDAALRALLANDITPDLMVSFDCKDDQNRLWREVPTALLQNIPALFNSCSHPAAIASWPGPVLFYNQYHTQDDLCKRILPDLLPELGQIPSSGTVGNMATLAAGAMGCDPVCVVGMDFCYQPVNADAYRYRAQDYRFSMDRGAGVPPGWEKTEIKELYDNDERLKRSFMVKGDEGKEYRVDPELTFYLTSFKNLMPHFKIPVVNCTPNGMLPKLKTDLQGATDGGFPMMTVGEAGAKYCKIEIHGGRSVLAHLKKIVPDLRPNKMESML